MGNIREQVEKRWFAVLLLTSLVCCVFLSLTFDLIAEYQIFLFLLLLIACVFLAIASTVAVRMSKLSQQKPSNAMVIIIAFILTATSILYCYHHGVFYGRKIIDATFLDDHSSVHLSLYSDGHYIINSNWMFGTEDFSGNYRMSENSIILDEYSPPKYLPKYLVKCGSKIYFPRDNYWQLQDTSFYHFKINSSN